MSTGETDCYLTFVGRGFHHVFEDMIVQSLDLQQYIVRVELIGEQHVDEMSYAHNLSIRCQNLAKQKCATSTNTTASTSRFPIGSLQLEERDNNCATKSHESFGYDYQNRLLWTSPGSFNGFVWIKITTNAPPFVIGNSLRCLGPFLALIEFRESMELDHDKDLSAVCEQLKNLSSFPSYNLRGSLDLWKRHVLECWPQMALSGASAAASSSAAATAAKSKRISYRLSCVRADTKSYKFKRQELMAACATSLIPTTPDTQHWKVDLKNYHMELVVFLKPHCLAFGISLRPYRQVFRALDFSGGSWPPDVTPPYLSGGILSGLVRLRPSTSQLLLHLASLQPGDVLLDPCVGIGTIPIEAQFSTPAIVSLGGDIILTRQGLAPISTDYVRLSQKICRKNTSNSFLLDLLCWDACQLPFRSGVVDAVVSDLPFGQSCLSSSKLNQILPLILCELARVLTRNSGRMVLLCGSFAPVLDALENANREGAAQGNIDEKVWELPCQAIFPVNVGGLVAWIIQVRRASGPPSTLKNRYVERLRKIVYRREMVQKAQAKDSQGKRKRLQS